MRAAETLTADASSSPDGGAARPGRRGRVAIGVLGALTVEADGDVLPVRRGLPRRLLSWLVIDRGRPLAADALVDRLWGERLPCNPANALQTQIAYLRRALGGAEVAPIETTAAGYVLTEVDVDIDRFERALADGRRGAATADAGELARALDAYDLALREWRGSPYEEIVGDERADAEVARLVECRLAAVEERADLLLRLGRTADAVAELRALVTADPLRERAQELLALALYRSGRQADALRALNLARRTLVEELGVEPGPALRELERRVLDQDPGLAPPPAVTAARRSGRWPVLAPGVPGPDQPDQDGLVGRDRDVAQVTKLLDERRLLTLTGPGGAGKTRLALEVARVGPARYHVVDLGGVEDGDDVPAVVAGALGVPLAGDDVLGPIGAALAGSLLVLDTCEHVIGAVAPLVAELLAAVPDLTVLATSRRPLALPAELAWPIPPLAVPTAGTDATRSPAFELFVRRARQAHPAFDVEEAGGVAAVAELCRALDGLPLAIELAAAQMDVITPRDVLNQLAEQRSPGGREVGPARQRTLGATTEWSVGLLDDPERDMLFRLAVFAPGFDVDAATAVAGDGDRALDRFVTLLRNSLVVPCSDGRYRLLDTVRGHLLAREPDARRRDDARRRHAEHYSRIASRSFEGVRGVGQAAWLRRIELDRANLRVALSWCFSADGDPALGARIAGDVAWAWTLSGNLLDARAALEEARRVDAEPLVRARVLLGVGLLAAPLGDHDAVIDACTQSAQIGRDAGHDETVAAALLTLGVSRWATGDLAGAAAAHDEAIERFDAAGERWGATICRTLRARTARDGGELELASSLLDVAVDDAKASEDDHVIGLAYEQLARLLLDRGLPGPALAAAEAALAHNGAVGYAEGISAALTVAARARAETGSTEPASVDLARALSAAADIGHVGAMCAAVEVAADLAERTGDHLLAARLVLVTERTRRRARLPLPPTVAQDGAARRERLREVIGGRAWDGVAAEAQMCSLTEVVGALLEHLPSRGVDAPRADGDPLDRRPGQGAVDSGWPASTHASLPPS